MARVAAGRLRCKIKIDGCSETLVITKPRLDDIYIANELYYSYKQEMEQARCFTEDEVIDWMRTQGLWTDEKEKMLVGLEKDIEEFKVKLFQLTFRSNEKNIARKALAEAKRVQLQLMQEKTSYHHLTTTGSASLLRSRYLIAMSIHTLGGKQFYDENSFWDYDASVLDQIVDFYYQSRLSDSIYRELARTEPWRVIWNGKKSEGTVFGLGSLYLSEEQRLLTMWSSIYDSIYEHPECPPDDILEDDDILDGWMIIQKRKRKEGADKMKAENGLSQKIQNAGERFIPADTMQDAKAVGALNDSQAEMRRRQRLGYVRKKGEVTEAEMPDSALEIQMRKNREALQAAKGKSNG